MGRVGKGWKIRVKKFHREIERGTGCVGFGFFFYLYLLSWFFVYIVVVQLVVVDDGQRVEWCMYYETRRHQTQSSRLTPSASVSECVPCSVQ